MIVAFFEWAPVVIMLIAVCVLVYFWLRKPANTMALVIHWTDGGIFAVPVASKEHAQRLLNRFNWSWIETAYVMNGDYINWRANNNGSLMPEEYEQ